MRYAGSRAFCFGRSWILLLRGAAALDGQSPGHSSSPDDPRGLPRSPPLVLTRPSGPGSRSSGYHRESEGLNTIGGLEMTTAGAAFLRVGFISGSDRVEEA